MDLTKLSLKEKIGQKFIFGVNSSNIDIIIKLIKEYHIGGVILYKKNYSSYNEMLTVIKRLKEANKDNKIPLFITIDQEGGRVNRMPLEIVNMKNIHDMSLKDKKLVKDNGLITGKMLYSLGINMNFAPVLDICEDNNSKVLFNRCFYGDEDNVYECGKMYVDSIQKNGVVSVVKHFPGHGVSMLDSHFFTPYVFNKNKILNKHIKPFERMINDGVDALMVGHLNIRGLTKGLPASISYDFINNYLRNKMQFDGLVITDEINMLSRNIFYRIGLANKVFKSGSDIFLYKLKENSSINLIDKYISFMKENSNYMKNLDDSVSRIVRIKKKFNINDNVDDLELDIDKINKEITRINEMC